MIIRPPEQMPRDYSAIKRKIFADYNANQSMWLIYQTEATIDSRLEAGDPSLMAELSNNFNANRNNYYFNRTRPLCNMVSGYQRRNRKSSVVVPLENGDQVTADQWTKLLLGVYKRESVYETISEAFHQGACITGMNMLHIYLDFRNDPICGDVKVDNLSYNQFFIDPFFRKPDLSDCNFVWRRSYLTHMVAASLMPDKYDEIMGLPGNPMGLGRDARFFYMPEAYGQNRQNLLSYDEYYYRDFRKQNLLVDTQTGESMEVKDDSDIDIDYFLDSNPKVKMMEREVPTVRLAIMIGDQVMYDGPNPLGIDHYPFIPVIGYYNSNLPYLYNRIQGICRSLRDPQLLLNRRILLSADAAESVVNTGWLFKENAVIDVNHLFQTGQGRIIPIKDEANIQTDIQQIQPPNIPPSFFQLQETFSKELNFVSGINEELMGSALDDKAGILSALRQGAGLTTLQPIFDRLDHAQNLLGHRLMEVMRMNYTPGKIKSMLEGEEPAPLFYNKAFGKYHCTVELGFNTETQKQMEFLQYTQLKGLGVNIPDARMIGAATIQNKNEIMEEMQQQAQQAAQMQQQQMESQMQAEAAQTELVKAKVLSDKGLGLERISRIEENRALAEERRAAAIKDDMQAGLNYVKSLAELDNMKIGQLDLHIAQLEKILSIQKMYKEIQNMDREKAELTSAENPQPEQNVSAQV